MQETRQGGRKVRDLINKLKPWEQQNGRTADDLEIRHLNLSFFFHFSF